MSQRPLSLSPDLKRLRDEGFDIEIVSGHLLVKQVPYVNRDKEVKEDGRLVAVLTLAGDVAQRPADHVLFFAGDQPCDADGQAIAEIYSANSTQDLGGITVHHSFSSKPDGGYADFYHKMSTYCAILEGPAQALKPEVTSRKFSPIPQDSSESVFRYLDTSSSRSGISGLAQKMENQRIAIVGLGGTGSYVLDLVAKTPVGEIHLYDADVFSQHNAFRSPGAASIEELAQLPKKVDYFCERYSQMHRGVVPHAEYVSEDNVAQLSGMDFVFVCIDRGVVKKLISDELESTGKSFIDVGMGVEIHGGALIGMLRVTTSTPSFRHAPEAGRVSFTDEAADDVYSRNIQIAELNSLNASMAVIKWKKLLGFYADLEWEQHSTYVTDGNKILNEDQSP